MVKAALMLKQSETISLSKRRILKRIPLTFIEFKTNVNFNR